MCNQIPFINSYRPLISDHLLITQSLECITVSRHISAQTYKTTKKKFIISCARGEKVQFTTLFRTDKISGCSWQFHSSPAGCGNKFCDQTTRYLQFSLNWTILVLSAKKVVFLSASLRQERQCNYLNLTETINDHNIGCKFVSIVCLGNSVFMW